MQFHPQGEILFTAGMDKTLRFFGIDGEHNQKMHSVHFNDLPIMSANWTMGGDQVSHAMLITNQSSHILDRY